MPARSWISAADAASPAQVAADDRAAGSTDPDLALAIDGERESRVAADLAPLADLERIAQFLQCARFIKERGDGGIGGAGGGVFGNADAKRRKSGEFLVSRARNSWEVLGMFRKTGFRVNY